MNGDSKVILDAVESVGRRIGEVEKNLRKDVGDIHKKIDDLIKDGIPICETHSVRIDNNTKNIDELKQKPQKSFMTIASVSALIMSFVAVVSLILTIVVRK